MRVSWIYKLRRDELVAELQKHNLDCDGKVTELRQRLVRYVRENEEEFIDKPLDREDYNELADITQDEIKHQLETMQRRHLRIQAAVSRYFNSYRRIFT